MARLKGKVAYITGAGAGIARAAALLFAAEGAAVGVAELDRAAGERTVAEITGAGGRARFFATDVSKPDQVEQAINGTAQAFGRLDIIYNCAGGSAPPDDSVTRMPIDAFWRNMQIDLFGTFLGCRFGIPHLQKAGGGSIINMTSVMAFMGEIAGFPPRHAYSAAKGGVMSLTKCIAVEYGKDKIRANAIAPCFIESERNKGVLGRMSNSERSLLQTQHRLGTGEPRDVAEAALFLASDESRLITGIVVPVDSGLLAA
ncbi:MAG: SDR family oxidoreductase [Alphaproteobacteria bacterium]|nr:SDR family oxidoreductase [Alphaproteobacteria bacterium]